jgi:hypothetical protein
MTPVRPKLWWLELAGMFAALTIAGAILLPFFCGHDWSGSLWPYVTIPVQMIASLFSFGVLFISRKYTESLGLGMLAVVVLSVLATFAMFATSTIHMASYGPGP